MFLENEDIVGNCFVLFVIYLHEITLPYAILNLNI